jgi:NAD(P)H dehydrogenase (quinone)
MAVANKPTILIVYYSMYGHIKTMAKSVAAGIEASGCTAKLMQVPETLSAEVLGKMGAPARDESIPTATAADLEAADGVIFGIPTRFGMAAAQVKAFMDTTGGLWGKGALVGKPASVFFSTGTQGGGQETTALTFYTQLVHHGMVIVPIGYSSKSLFNMDEVHGGSPYGAGCFAGGDGSRQPSKLELETAEHQGKHFSTIAAALKKGKE